MRPSISLRGIIWATLPSFRIAIAGDDGGWGLKYSRARAVASASWPAKTVVSASGSV